MDKEQEFLNHIRKHADGNDFVAKYIFSGLAVERNFDGKLTKSIFKKNFYVERDKNIQSKYENLINELFKDETHGILGIRAHGGSGKTTAIEMIETRLEPSCPLKKFLISFKSSDSHFIGAINRINKICKNYFLEAINNHGILCNKIECNIQIILNILEQLSDDSANTPIDYDELLNFWGIIQNTTLNNLLRERSITNRLLSLTGSSTAAVPELVSALLFLCLLIVSYSQFSNDESKYLVIFDNIEYVTPNSIGNIIKSSWQCLKTIFERDDELCTAFNKVKFIICARTTTGLSSTQNNIGTWGNNDKYIIDIEGSDFCAEALLKKLYYLNKVNLRYTKTFKITKLICQLICGINNTESYLTNGIIQNTGSNKDAEFTEFAKKYFSPFFGNDYRQLADRICACLLDPQNEEAVKKIEELLNQATNKADLYELSINGARNILWHLIFKSMNGNPKIIGSNIFAFFGIHPIDTKDRNHSLTRIILSYMYWDKICHLVNNSWNLASYSGITLKKLSNNVLKYFYNDNEIAKSIYKLSNLCSPHDDEKRNKLNSYTYFITINTYGLAKHLQEGNLPIEEYGDVRLELSPAGICYVHHVSPHFEFFSTRDIHYSAKPLIMHDATESDYREAYIAINNIYGRISDYSIGMINNCNIGCNNYRNSSAPKCAYLRAQANELSTAEIFNCSLFIRLVQVNAAIISIIDYIDRYRQHLLFKESNTDTKRAINENLLTLIEKFAKLFKETKSLIRFPDNKYYSFMQEKIYPKYNTLDNSANLEKLGLYQTLSNSRLSYYAKGKSSDYIFQAITKEKANLNPTSDLYQVCVELAKSSNPTG